VKRLQSEQAVLEADISDALQRERNLEIMLAQVQSKNQFLEDRLPKMEEENKKLIRRINLLEKVAQNEQVFTSRLSESYAENERLAQELQQLEVISRKKRRRPPSLPMS